jgi:alpha-tubulin suppressor-like RCC1 family protein
LVASNDDESGTGFENGTLLAWGLLQPPVITEPTEIQLGSGNEHAADVAGGGYHALVLTDLGRVFAIGRNEDGQLGDGTTEARRLNATLVTGALAGKAITRVAAGLSHSIAVTRDHHVYAWGSNARGQLGVNSTAVAFSTPQLVSAVDWQAHGGVVDVCAGGQHSVVVTRDGSAFSFGGASWGATALDHTDDVATPTSVTVAHLGSGAELIEQVECGGDHTLFLLRDGSLLASGWNEHGQAGVGHRQDLLRATPIAFSSDEGARVRVRAMSGGAYAHSAAVDADGNVWTWGLGEHGALGHEDSDARDTPTRIAAIGADEARRAIAVASGFKHTLVLVRRKIMLAVSGVW